MLVRLESAGVLSSVDEVGVGEVRLVGVGEVGEVGVC